MPGGYKRILRWQRGLRRLLERPGVVLAAGAHDALSAKIARGGRLRRASGRAGFDISASHAVPDANILTMAENLDAAADDERRDGIPVVADCDNGYGNAINVMRTASEYERAGIAGICIEDNVFPKRCSFYAGVRRELVAGRGARAARSRRRGRRGATRDFVVIARTEALIAGWGMDEALRRARPTPTPAPTSCSSTRRARLRRGAPVRRSVARRGAARPLVAVPTTYRGGRSRGARRGGLPHVDLRQPGAARRHRRHARRAAPAARDRPRGSVDDRIVPLEEVYASSASRSSRRTSSASSSPARRPRSAVILAAGFEPQLLPLTEDRPKTMLEVKGRTILERQIEVARARAASATSWSCAATRRSR